MSSRSSIVFKPSVAFRQYSAWASVCRDAGELGKETSRTLDWAKRVEDTFQRMSLLRDEIDNEETIRDHPATSYIPSGLRAAARAILALRPKPHSTELMTAVDKPSSNQVEPSLNEPFEASESLIAPKPNITPSYPSAPPSSIAPPSNPSALQTAHEPLPSTMSDTAPTTPTSAPAAPRRINTARRGRGNKFSISLPLARRRRRAFLSSDSSDSSEDESGPVFIRPEQSAGDTSRDLSVTQVPPAIDDGDVIIAPEELPNANGQHDNTEIIVEKDKSPELGPKLIPRVVDVNMSVRTLERGPCTTCQILKVKCEPSKLEKRSICKTCQWKRKKCTTHELLTGHTKLASAISYGYIALDEKYFVIWSPFTHRRDGSLFRNDEGVVTAPPLSLVQPESSRSVPRSPLGTSNILEPPLSSATHLDPFDVSRPRSPANTTSDSNQFDATPMTPSAPAAPRRINTARRGRGSKFSLSLPLTQHRRQSFLSSGSHYSSEDGSDTDFIRPEHSAARNLRPRIVAQIPPATDYEDVIMPPEEPLNANEQPENTEIIVEKGKGPELGPRLPPRVVDPNMSVRTLEKVCLIPLNRIPKLLLDLTSRRKGPCTTCQVSKVECEPWKLEKRSSCKTCYFKKKKCTTNELLTGHMSLATAISCGYIALDEKLSVIWSPFTHRRDGSLFRNDAGVVTAPPLSLVQPESSRSVPRSPLGTSNILEPPLSSATHLDPFDVSRPRSPANTTSDSNQFDATPMTPSAPAAPRRINTARRGRGSKFSLSLPLTQHRRQSFLSSGSHYSSEDGSDTDFIRPEQSAARNLRPRTVAQIPPATDYEDVIMPPEEPLNVNEQPENTEIVVEKGKGPELGPRLPPRVVDPNMSVRTLERGPCTTCQILKVKCKPSKLEKRSICKTCQWKRKKCTTHELLTGHTKLASAISYGYIALDEKYFVIWSPFTHRRDGSLFRSDEGVVTAPPLSLVHSEFYRSAPHSPLSTSNILEPPLPSATRLDALNTSQTVSGSGSRASAASLAITTNDPNHSETTTRQSSASKRKAAAPPADTQRPSARSRRESWSKSHLPSQATRSTSKHSTKSRTKKAHRNSRTSTSSKHGQFLHQPYSQHAETSAGGTYDNTVDLPIDSDGINHKDQEENQRVIRLFSKSIVGKPLSTQTELLVQKLLTLNTMRSVQFAVARRHIRLAQRNFRVVLKELEREEANFLVSEHCLMLFQESIQMEQRMRNRVNHVDNTDEYNDVENDDGEGSLHVRFEDAN